MTLEQIKSKGSLSDKAYYILKDAILELKLKPGEMLIEEEVSEKLGISRTPLRAAFQRLAFDSLIEIIPGKGTYVTPLSINYFIDLFALREALELLSVKLAAINRTEYDVLKLRSLVEKQLEMSYIKPLDTQEYVKIDREVHSLFGDLSKNQLVRKHLTTINEAYNRYLRFVGFRDRATVVAREHLLIVDAIDKMDSILAQELMRRHIQDVKESILLGLINQNYEIKEQD